jgi:hypothetical protein
MRLVFGGEDELQSLLLQCKSKKVFLSTRLNVSVPKQRDVDVIQEKTFWRGLVTKGMVTCLFP